MYIDSQQLQRIRQYLAGQPVLKAYLFGSYARGEATTDSDIDLLVELDYTTEIGLRFVAMQADLEKLLAHPVDLVSARGLSPYLQPIIDREKQVVYVR